MGGLSFFFSLLIPSIYLATICVNIWADHYASFSERALYEFIIQGCKLAVNHLRYIPAVERRHHTERTSVAG